MEFNSEEKDAIVQKIQRYFEQELNQEIGQFDALFLLDFFAEKIGPYFYNKGLQDAQTVLTAKMADIEDALYELEKPVE